MEKAVKFRTIMNGPYRDHPNEDALERFLLNQSEEEELEIVETHILACESCVTRLETLELNIAATKLALQNIQAEQAAKLAQPTPSRSNWFGWLTVPRLSFAGSGLAACALAFTFISVPRDVDVLANRGTETTMVSEWLPLDLHLDARDLPSGPVNIEIVDANGGKIWQGKSTVQNEKLEVKSSRLTSAGSYLIHVSSPSGELLREYSIQAKPLF
jgi:hypothetical protein